MRLQELGAEVVIGDLLNLNDVRLALSGIRGAYFVYPVLRQNLVTIDIVDFLHPSATPYWYEGITFLAVLHFESITQRSMQFGSREPCLTATTCHPEANPKAARNQYKGPPVLGLVISNLV